ncbi:cell division protein FtsA [bacterium]|nr:cell division protein FtsA [bacterium]
MGEIIGSLDLGSSKTVFVVVEEGGDGELELLGFGEAPSEGIINGVVVNPEKAEKGILAAAQDAQKIANKKLKNIITCVNGEHLKSVNSKGVITIPKNQDHITITDVARVKRASEAIVLPADTRIVDSIVHNITVDGEEGILDPVGMSGMRMEANVTLITADLNKLENTRKAVERVGMSIQNIYASAVCAAEAVLTPEEKEVGVALVEIGSGTTGICIYQNGKVRHHGVIKYAGDSITKDISIGLQIAFKQAEQLKLKEGCAFQSLVQDEVMVKVPGLGGREEKQISAKFLTRIIEARVEEILVMVKEQIERFTKPNQLAGGIVFTGGTAQLKGILNLARQVFGIQLRIGLPKIFGENVELVNSPTYASVIGAVKYNLRKKSEFELSHIFEESAWERFWSGIRRWLLRRL